MVYIINAFLILFWNFIIADKYKNKKLILCCLYAVQWIIISGFRSYSIGSDTFAYKLHGFDVTANKSWNYVINNFINYIKGSSGIKDPGYMIIEKAYQTVFGCNYTGFLIFIACIFTIPLAVWVYRYSDNVCLSFMIYSALFYSFFAITGHRQTIATALVFFGGYSCLKRKKYLSIIILHIVAFFIHKSSICFIVFYMSPVIKKIDWKFWIAVIILFILSWLFRNQLMRFLGETMGYESYMDQFEGAGTTIFTLFMSIILVATICLYPLTDQNDNIRDMVMGLVIAFFFIPLTYIDPSAMRIVQYFSIFIMLLVPRLISVFDKQGKLIANAICYFILVGYLVLANPQYAFVFM